MDDFKKFLEGRRTIYALGKDVSISESEIEKVISQSVKYVPSAFNMQSQKVVLLLNKNHDQMWDIVMETLRKIVPAESFAKTETKINAFKSAYGTVLFFNDDAVTKKYGDDFPLYRENFIRWSEQQNGMLQYAIWVGLSNLNLGASLQHYNPLIDAEVKRVFNIPASWSLIAQMPFGEKHGEADSDKSFLPIEERLLIKR
ncbi:MAG: nitroreductase family protein [Bacilli bacterium]|jgi:predicted oxidoreductase (fatty acid repression mutant protein)|nr:nitroreductase family protein [Bacilli bacterium]